MGTWFNLSGTLNAFRAIRDPTLCLPHYTVSTFNHLPVPLKFKSGAGKEPDIRAIVLDKDNCFAIPHKNEVFHLYKEKFKALREAYPDSKLLIVSNTAGTAGDVEYKQAKLLEENTGVHVLRHDTKKPGCHEEIMQRFRSNPKSGVTSPNQVAVIGDRLLTDVMMANSMGSYGIWIRDGVKEGGETPNLIARLEARLADTLSARGYHPPDPESYFESG